MSSQPLQSTETDIGVLTHVATNPITPSASDGIDKRTLETESPPSAIDVANQVLVDMANDSTLVNAEPPSPAPEKAIFASKHATRHTSLQMNKSAAVSPTLGSNKAVPMIVDEPDPKYTLTRLENHVRKSNPAAFNALPPIEKFTFEKLRYTDENGVQHQAEMLLVGSYAFGENGNSTWARVTPTDIVFYKQKTKGKRAQLDKNGKRTGIKEMMKIDGELKEVTDKAKYQIRFSNAFHDICNLKTPGGNLLRDRSRADVRTRRYVFIHYVCLAAGKLDYISPKEDGAPVDRVLPHFLSACKDILRANQGRKSGAPALDNEDLPPAPPEPTKPMRPYKKRARTEEDEAEEDTEPPTKRAAKSPAPKPILQLNANNNSATMDQLTTSFQDAFQGAAEIVRKLENANARLREENTRLQAEAYHAKKALSEGAADEDDGVEVGDLKLEMIELEQKLADMTKDRDEFKRKWESLAEAIQFKLAGHEKEGVAESSVQGTVQGVAQGASQVALQGSPQGAATQGAAAQGTALGDIQVAAQEAARGALKATPQNLTLGELED